MHLGSGAPLAPCSATVQDDRAAPGTRTSVCAILATYQRRCYVLASEEQATSGRCEPQGSLKSLLWAEP